MIPNIVNTELSNKELKALISQVDAQHVIIDWDEYHEEGFSEQNFIKQFKLDNDIYLDVEGSVVEWSETETEINFTSVKLFNNNDGEELTEEQYQYIYNTLITTIKTS